MKEPVWHIHTILIFVARKTKPVFIIIKSQKETYQRYSWWVIWGGDSLTPSIFYSGFYVNAIFPPFSMVDISMNYSLGK